MYGAGTQAAVSDAPVRQIQSIHSDTLECLTTAIRGLDALIAKTIGPEPINANEKPPMPIRSMQGTPKTSTKWRTKFWRVSNACTTVSATTNNNQFDCKEFLTDLMDRAIEEGKARQCLDSLESLYRIWRKMPIRAFAQKGGANP